MRHTGLALSTAVALVALSLVDVGACGGATRVRRHAAAVEVLPAL